jgi:hypothetical protein
MEKDDRAEQRGRSLHRREKKDTFQKYGWVRRISPIGRIIEAEKKKTANQTDIKDHITTNINN